MGKIGLILILLISITGLAIAATNPPFANSAGSSFTGGNNWQSYQPSFDRLYSGSISDYWPILSQMENEQCDATSDFIIGIPPGGCTPMVVRSDLLAEQNVPVFCSLYAIKVNPLIKVSSIKSISFKGDRPEEVAGISFHPARAAVKSYNTLLGDPMTENIGYVVIILKRQPDERNLAEYVSGMLTATIYYDADMAYGTGRSEYYAPVISDSEWNSGEYKRYSFWQGRGYVRVTDVDRDSATIQILSDKDKVLQTHVLKEGQTSPISYMPGYYCKAGLKVKLNKLETPEDSALINIDGSDLWVRQGTKILDGACTVSSINIDGKNLLSNNLNIAQGIVDFFSNLSISLDFLGDGYNSVTTATYDKDKATFDFGLKGSGTILGSVETKVSVPKNGKLVEVDGYKITLLDKTTQKPILSNNLPVIYMVEKTQLDSSGLKTLFRDKAIDTAKQKIEENEKSPGSSSNFISPSAKSGFVRISCPGKTLELRISPREGIKAEEGKEIIGLTDVSNQNIDSVFIEANNTVINLTSDFPTESKGGALGTYGEEALYEQIILAERASKQATAQALIGLFLEKYPSSKLVGDLILKQSRFGAFDYSRAIGGAFVNGQYHTIGLYEILDAGTTNKSVTLGVLGKGRKNDLKEGDKVSLGNDREYLEIKKIEPSKVTIAYVNTNDNANPSRDSKTIYEGDRMNIGPQVEVSVENINAEEMAYVSLIPEVKHTKTEANFTFKIGIEKRGIDLSPKKTKEMLTNINKSIERFDDINEKLGNLIKGWKGACFATSAILTVKSMATSFDGTALARQKVMAKYKAECDREYGVGNRDLCYQKKSEQIEKDVEEMRKALVSVNEKMEAAQKGNIREGGFLDDGSIINQSTYLDSLRREVGDSWEKEVNGVKITAKDLQTETQLRAALLDKQFGSSTSIASQAADSETDSAFRNIAQIKADSVEKERLAKELNLKWGTSIKGATFITPEKVRNFQWSGSYASAIPNLDLRPEKVVVGGKEQTNTPDKSTTRIEPVGTDGGKEYLAVLGSPATNGMMGIEEFYERDSSGGWKIVEPRPSGFEGVVFSGGNIESEGDCSNNWPRETAKIVYYESGNNKGLPAIVPFDLSNGWYVMVPNSGGSFVDNAPKGYTASGDVQYFRICNIGKDRVMSSGIGDDFCSSFDVNSAASVTEFPCKGMSSAEVNRLYGKAREAIRQASSQRGQKTVSIFDQVMGVGESLSEIGGFECTDFMSPSDCNLMFNVCDPVICPASRCDMGGENPVSDVIQTGIIGSIIQCLPNAKEGIYVPICVSGIHAGIDAFNSILKSERDCLQRSLETGEMVGICDEITAVYKCEFFWKQAAPLMNMALPKLISGISGTGSESTRGGGEYMLVQTAWDNTQKSIDYFKNNYAQNAFRAFELRSVEEAGGTFCKAFIGSSFPTSADAFESLLEPESPAQFYAYFSEDIFSEATVPSTSHYKVYYHIYAGKDIGTQYRVYLKNPPASSYYQNNQIITVKTGYIARGSSADESIDFTAPSGYKELCVSIGTQEKCGFKQVTTDAGLNILEAKYTADQANKTDISTEKECISGSPSSLALVSPNLQAGVDEAINPNIALRGIVRVCATNNPGISSGNTDRWTQIGTCDTNLYCWQDKESVKEDLRLLSAVNNATSIQSLSNELSQLDQTRLTYEQTESILSRIREAVDGLNNPTIDSVKPLLIELDRILAIGDSKNTAGSGTNAQKAESLALKATIYRALVIEGLKKSTPQTPNAPRPQETPISNEVSTGNVLQPASQEGPTQVNLIPSGVIKNLLLGYSRTISVGGIAPHTFETKITFDSNKDFDKYTIRLNLFSLDKDGYVEETYFVERQLTSKEVETTIKFDAGEFLEKYPKIINGKYYASISLLVNAKESKFLQQNAKDEVFLDSSSEKLFEENLEDYILVEEYEIWKDVSKSDYQIYDIGSFNELPEDFWKEEINGVYDVKTNKVTLENSLTSTKINSPIKIGDMSIRIIEFQEGTTTYKYYIESSSLKAGSIILKRY